jgi:hypothetical protein
MSLVVAVNDTVVTVVTGVTGENYVSAVLADVGMRSE